jgi:hypothetical protein
MFEVDDVEEAWTYKHKFDLIFMRMMTGSLSDWPRCFEQCYELKCPFHPYNMSISFGDFI